ncbi:MAG: hypothetical protein K8R74_09395 [Bacteroidales bacterium]|nr:hypothetical protein [Bacteroidales bacterium]
MNWNSIYLVGIIILVAPGIFAQNDNAVYKEKKDGFYQNTIQKEIKEFKNRDNETIPGTYLSVDFEGKDFPVNIDEYTQFWHNPPLSQGATGTCWCFGSVSYLESEIFRTTGQKVQLSEMFFVYHEYIERAQSFVKERGNMNFGQGSEANAVPKLMKKYGAVPASAYTGKLEGQEFHNHDGMLKELKAYLKWVKESNSWNEQMVINTFKNILNTYMTEPPSIFIYEGKEITPKEYLENSLQLDPDDYFSFMSTQSKTYNEKGELVEPDNWWHDDSYYNVHLDDFLFIFKSAITEGYTMSFCGDVSEPGYDRYEEVGIIPSYDIPSDYINEDSREYRMYNKSTTDDHCMHIVGYTEVKDDWWFLIKDSSSSGFDGPNKGYRFMHEDYIRLKILTILVYKYGAKDVLDDIIK